MRLGRWLLIAFAVIVVVVIASKSDLQPETIASAAQPAIGVRTGPVYLFPSPDPEEIPIWLRPDPTGPWLRIWDRDKHNIAILRAALDQVLARCEAARTVYRQVEKVEIIQQAASSVRLHDPDIATYRWSRIARIEFGSFEPIAGKLLLKVGAGGRAGAIPVSIVGEHPCGSAFIPIPGLQLPPE